MLSTYKLDGETWIDIDNGSPDEIQKVMGEYNIHPFVAKEIISATPKPRIDLHNHYIYCILHFPAFRHTHSNRLQEVDFVIGRNILITARYDNIDAIEEFSKEVEIGEILEHFVEKNSGNNNVLFMVMLKKMYSSIFEELDYIEDLTEKITAKIFQGKEKEMVISISQVIRTLLDFKKTIDTHKEILESLKTNGREILGNNFSYQMETVLTDYLKIKTSITSNLEMLYELRNTNNSLLSSKQNETIRQLTVMGFIIVPLNLIAWIFAMRTAGMPLVDNPNAFWIVIGMMVTAAIISLVYVKHKKWL